MEQPPRRGNSLFSDGMVSSIALEGAMIGMLALLAFGIGHIYFDEEGAYITGRTMAFAVLSLSQLIHAFNMRSEAFAVSDFALGEPDAAAGVFYRVSDADWGDYGAAAGGDFQGMSAEWKEWLWLRRWHWHPCRL